MVVPRFPKLSETFIVSKFLGLLARGWDVHIVCGEAVPEGWTQFPDLPKRADARRRCHPAWPQSPKWYAALLLPWAVLRCWLVNPAGTWRYFRYCWPKFGWQTVLRLYADAELLCLRPDMIHFEFGAGAVDRMHLKSILGCKLVVGFRGYDLNYVGLEEPRFYDSVWAGADALHLLGEDLWRRAQRRGCPSHKVHALIPPAIDVEFFDPGPEGPTAPYDEPRALKILSVGRLEWKKGFDYALEAVRNLVDRGIACEYEIVGDGAYQEPLLFTRHQLNLDRVARFTGALPRWEVREKMRQADVFLHPAVSEGFCNAVLEAQAMRLPVVCSDADGLSENVADGETGFVTPRRDAQAMADKLEWLARHPVERLQMGAAGRRRVKAYFQLKDQIAAFERLYEQARLSQPAVRSRGRSPGEVASPSAPPMAPLAAPRIVASPGGTPKQ